MKHSKSKRRSRFITFVLVAAVVIGGYFVLNNSDILSTTYTAERIATSTIEKQIDSVSADEKERQKALAQIMTREEFQKQQELLAEEIYINEQVNELKAQHAQEIEKLDAERAEMIAKLDAQKAAQIEKFNAEKAALDSQVEDVRHELVSFGSAPQLSE